MVESGQRDDSIGPASSTPWRHKERCRQVHESVPANSGKGGAARKGRQAATKGPRDGRALESPRRNGARNGFGPDCLSQSGPIMRCGAPAPLFVLFHTECRWNAHWFVRRNHLRRSVEKLGFGSLAGEGLQPQGGGVRVMGRRTTEHRLRQRGWSTDHRVERRATGSSRQSGGLARRRGPSSSAAASPSRRAASPLHPRGCFEADAELGLASAACPTMSSRWSSGHGKVGGVAIRG